MTTLGFRAGARDLSWAVVVRREDGKIAVIADGIWKAPQTYDEGKSLSWYRDKALSLIEQHKPDGAGIRYPEPSAPKKNVASGHMRVRLEGVILQSLDGQSITVETGAFASIGSRLKSKTPKGYLEREEFRGLDLSNRPKERQEAILVAISALGNENGN